MKLTRRSLLFWTSYAILLVLFAGMITHTCWSRDVLDKYSMKYAAALVAVFLLLCAWKGVFSLLAKDWALPLGGGRRVVFSLRRKALLGATAVALVLCGGEALVRQREPFRWRPAESEAVYDPYLQNRLKPGDQKLHVNAEGFRGDDLSSIGTNALRVFFIGGSTVLSGGVAYTNSHPYLLQQNLRGQLPNRSVIVQNAGNHWHTSQHSLIKYQTRVRYHNPDIVIIWHGINDLYRSFVPHNFCRPDTDYKDDYSHFYGPVAPIVRRYFQGERNPPVVSLLLFEKLGDVLFSDFRDTSLVVGHEEERAVRVSEFPSVHAYRRNMELLIGAIRRDGAVPVIATQPFHYSVDMSDEAREGLWMHSTFCRDAEGRHADIESMIAGMNQFNDATRALGRELGVSVIELEPAVPKTMEYFRDDCHYTRAGNVLVAETVFQHLVASRILGDLPQMNADEWDGADLKPGTGL